MVGLQKLIECYQENTMLSIHIKSILPVFMKFIMFQFCILYQFATFKQYEDGDSRLRLREGSVLSFACHFMERYSQKKFLDANESREQALEV